MTFRVAPALIMWCLLWMSGATWHSKSLYLRLRHHHHCHQHHHHHHRHHFGHHRHQYCNGGVLADRAVLTNLLFYGGRPHICIFLEGIFIIATIFMTTTTTTTITVIITMITFSTSIFVFWNCPLLILNSFFPLHKLPNFHQITADAIYFRSFQATFQKLHFNYISETTFQPLLYAIVILLFWNCLTDNSQDLWPKVYFSKICALPMKMISDNCTFWQIGRVSPKCQKSWPPY